MLIPNFYGMGLFLLSGSSIIMLLQFFTSFGFRTDQWILELEALHECNLLKAKTSTKGFFGIWNSFVNEFYLIRFSRRNRWRSSLPMCFLRLLWKENKTNVITLRKRRLVFQLQPVFCALKIAIMTQVLLWKGFHYTQR